MSRCTYEIVVEPVPALIYSLFSDSRRLKFFVRFKWRLRRRENHLIHVLNKRATRRSRNQKNDEFREKALGNNSSFYRVIIEKGNRYRDGKYVTASFASSVSNRSRSFPAPFRFPRSRSIVENERSVMDMTPRVPRNPRSRGRIVFVSIEGGHARRNEKRTRRERTNIVFTRGRSRAGVVLTLFDAYCDVYGYGIIYGTRCFSSSFGRIVNYLHTFAAGRFESFWGGRLINGKQFSSARKRS